MSELVSHNGSDSGNVSQSEIAAGSGLARTPAPPYYAAIFTSVRTNGDPGGYARAAARMLELAAQQPGYLGVESVREEGGLGITVSYWNSLDSIRAWRVNAEHQVTQQAGRSRWYAQYELRICRVERAIHFAADNAGPDVVDTA